MKTIKVFIASSEELKEERVLMASLANELSTQNLSTYAQTH